MGQHLNQSMSDASLPYATPSVAGRSYLPEIILALTLLGLIFLGGCFLIGVLIQQSQIRFQAAGSSPVWSRGEILFSCVLYIISFGCFATAAGLLGCLVRRLRR
jgi:ABC-type multidrug transport system permease subunit